MKKIIFLTAVAAVAFALTLHSCKPDEEQVASPSLNLERTEVTVPAEGGSFTVAYKIENPLADVKVVCECAAEWLGPFDTSKEGIISFQVDANTDENARNAVVEVIYGEESESFTVLQDGLQPVVPDEGFMLVIDEVSMTDMSWTVIPADDEMPYISMSVDKRVYDQFGSDEAYIEEDLQLFNLMAGSSGMTLEEYLDWLVKYGEYSFYKDGLLPGYAYYVYAYGISLSGELLTGMYKEEVVMESPEKVDISFEITCEPGLDTVAVSVTPSIQEQRYVVDAYPKEEISEAITLEEWYSYKFNERIAAAVSEGMSVEKAVISLTEVGTATVVLDNLRAETDYTVLVVAVNEEGLFVSDVATDEFRTDGLFSDNVIEVEITDITPDGASYSISTTNDDPYVMYYIQASMWEDWSDEDIIRNLIEYYDVEENNVYRGDKSGTITGLMTKTKYVMYTFGCESGTATTSLGKTFFTPESGSSDVTFTLKFDKYFNGDDLIAAYPEEESYKQYAGKAVLPVKAEVSDPSATYLYYVYSVDYSEYGDDVLYSSLLNGTGLSEPSYVFSRNFGRVCTVAGFAIDEDGNNGPLFRTSIEFTLEGASPISEFTPDMLSSD